MLELSLQLEALINSAHDSIGFLNRQLQGTSKMTSQNQAVSDLILLKKKGICGKLNLSVDDRPHPKRFGATTRTDEQDEENC